MTEILSVLKINSPSDREAHITDEDRYTITSYFYILNRLYHDDIKYFTYPKFKFLYLLPIDKLIVIINSLNITNIINNDKFEMINLK